MEEDPAVQKVAISGPTLASLIQRISTSPGDVDGLLFGHVSNSLISSISDDDDPSTSSATTTLISTVTSFIAAPTKPSFYHSSGQIDSSSLRRLLPSSSSSLTLIGWFSSRRNTVPRPSLREFSVSASLSSISQFRLPLQNQNPNPSSSSISPCLFLLFTTPPTTNSSVQVIHTHEYRAYQFRKQTLHFDPKSIDVVNVGPAFRGHYCNFTPSSPFPILTCETRRNPMAEDDDNNGIAKKKKQQEEQQKELDLCSEGFQVGALSRLVGPDASSYTAGLEDLYENMLTKLDNLARLVDTSSAKVLEQENHNMKLRYKVAGLE